MNKQIKNLAAIAGMATMASPLSVAEETDPTTNVKPITVSATYTSKSAYTNGYISGDDTLQNFVSMDLGAGFGAFVWSSFDMESNKFDEVDVGLTYSKSLGEKFTATAALKQWYYPTEKIGEHSDTVLALNFAYSGKVDANVRVSQVLTGNKWGFVDGGISKSFAGPYDTTITPGVGIGFTFDGETLADGITFAQVTPKLGISKTLSNDWNANASFSYQIGQNGAESTPYVGFSLSKKF